MAAGWRSAGASGHAVVIPALVMALALTGCGTPLKLHDVPPEAAPTPRFSAPERAALAPIAFTRIGADLARGKVIGSAYYVPLKCALSATPEITWARARFLTHDVEFQDAFFKTFDGAGFNVIGRPDDLFKTADTRRHPAFEIGAQIRDLRINLCREMHFLLSVVTDRVSGEASAVIDWQVYSSLTRKVVARFQTTGTATQEQALADGDRVLLVHAFADAARRLAGDNKLRALLAGTEIRDPAAAPRRDAALALPRVVPSATPIAGRMNAVMGATVTVLMGGGHGSGFVISRDGLILTNNHVVADAPRVRVRFASGVQVDGTVLRRDATRDVALLRVPVTHDAPLPIRAAPARVGEDVYVVGTPIYEANAATVTRGIVSALRDDGPSGQLIQSDATIHGGNSGGPLLDRYGNVIGIAVAAQVDSATGSVAPGLNYFIPVGEALQRLNLTPGD